MADRLRPISAFVVSLLVAACGASSVTQAPSSSTVATASPTARPSAQPTYPPDAFTALVLNATGGATPAGSDLDLRWADVFKSVRIAGARPYTPPDAVLGYRAGDIPATACTGTTGPAAWIDNAIYCPADDRIIYDEDWLRGFAKESGDFAPLAILAHEWGHHVQAVMGDVPGSIQRELQADCFAGLYLTTSPLLPHTTGDAEDPYIRAALSSMFKLGNKSYKESEWFAAAEHGSPVQRLKSIATGLLAHQEVEYGTGAMTTGLPYCYGYRDFKPGAYLTIGPYRLLQSPGHLATRDGDTVTIPPETRTGQVGSTLAVTWMDKLPLKGGATDAQIPAIWADPNPGFRMIAAPFPVLPATAGTGRGHYYELVRDTKDPSTTESGIVALFSPASGLGGLLVRSFRQQPAPPDQVTADDLAVLQEELTTLFQMVSRLCTPDESGDLSASTFDQNCGDAQ